MTGCAACDEWVRELAARAEHPAEPVARDCPTCHRTVVAQDIRPSDQEAQTAMSETKEYALDAERRHGEVKARIGTKVWLRPVGGGLEWDVPADTITPADADGNPLPAEVAP